jgi:two-component system NarL family sensor kinase
MNNSDEKTLEESSWKSALHVFETIPDLYLILSAELSVLKASNTFIQALNQVKSSFYGLDANAIFTSYGAADSSFVSSLMNSIQQVVQTGKQQHIDTIYLSNVYREAGTSHQGGYFQIVNSPVFDTEGKLRYIIHKLNDFTAAVEKDLAKESLKLANVALKNSHDLLQSVFDTTLIGMSLLKPIRNEQGQIVEFTIMLVSKELEIETGRTDLVGTLYSKEFPGIKKSGIYDLMLRVMESGKSEHLEYYYPFDGFDKYFSCTFVKMEDGLVASNLDITPIRKAEAKLREMKENQKLEIFKACISTEEEERKRVAEDLRNGIGQLLYAVKINLKEVGSARAINNPMGFQQSIQYTDKILGEAITEIRRLSHQMTPSILEDFGLAETINELCKQVSSEIKINCKMIGLESRFANYFEVSVYRIIQELLLNAVRHAEASEVNVELKLNEAWLNVIVNDNGLGFIPDEAIKKGLGLARLLNKVSLLNGSSKIECDHGTKVFISLPIVK